MLKTKWFSLRSTKLFVLFLWVTIASILPSCSSHFLGDTAQLDTEVSRLIRTSPNQEEYPDADVIYLLDEDIEEVSSDGSCRETARKVIKILREAGKQFANCEIGYDSRTETVSLLYARTIMPDGRIITLKKNALKVVTPHSDFSEYSDYKKLIFSLPGVQVGSVIDYKYLKKRKPIIDGEFSSEFIVQWYQPVMISIYAVIAPESMDIKYMSLNPLEEDQSSLDIFSDEGKKVYCWTHFDIPQILNEDNMPPIDEIACRVLITTLDSWDKFFGWWSRKIEGKSDPDKAIKKKVVELTGSLSSESKKIEVLFDYVKREVRYVSIDVGKSGYEPRTAQEVFDTKYGDCKDKSTLLLSMLKSAGIPAYYVLIPTTSTGNLIKDFPYPFQFNHCIVAVENEDGYHFLDPVAENTPFDYLPEEDQNRCVLIFKQDQPSFRETPLAKAEDNAVLSQTEIEIMPDGSIQVDRHKSLSGEKQLSFRYALIDNTPAEKLGALQEAVNELFPGAKLIDYSHSDPFDFKKRLEIRFKYLATDYCKKAGETLIFQIPKSDIGERCAEASSMESRTHPILHHSRYYYRDQVEFNVPEGYEVYHLPQKIEVKNPYFEYHSSYEENGHKIRYQAELLETAVHIPQEDYNDYKTSCDIMNKSHTRYILFRKKDQKEK